MKKFITQFVGITLSLLLVNSGVAQLSASSSTNADELVEIFLSENSNLTFSNATLTGADGAAGTYEGADFDEDNGVILSTGLVADAAGPNDMLGQSTNNGTVGDADLEELADKSTFDAVSLSADFIPNGSSISFKYAFASEDYNAYVCSPFSDVLGVFVSGGEYVNQNIALVPGTDLLVTSNTINGGTEGDVWNEEDCPEGGLDNANLYLDNEDGLNHEYNGRTVFLNTDLTVTPGETYNIRWALADGSDGIFDSALFLEAGSLSSSEGDCITNGGELTVDGPSTVCKSDGIDDSFSLEVEGAEGENMIFVVTFDDGQIIALSENGEFNLEGIPGNGTCLFWNLSWDGEIEGAEVGQNAFDITGDCFDLSNSVAVTEYFTDGGEISTEDPTTICVDDEPDPIDVSLEGEEGENMAWVITDTDLNILDLPAGPPFDLNGAGLGVCLIWHLSWSGDLEGAEIGANAGDLSGDCFDLSNSIEVIREECDDCTAEGGELTVDGPTVICKSDGIDDSFTLSVEGAEGENMTYVVTWEDGEIILISDDPEFNLEGIPGNGVCLFWNLSWDGEIEGAEVGENAFDITGDCFDLSNSVAVTEYFTDGGEISTDDPTTICVDDEPDPIDVSLEGEEGENMAWVITDTDLNILDLPAGPPFDLNGAGVGTCLIWHLSWSGDLEGAEIGENAGELSGDCFDLSNSIEVIREECDDCTAEGGELTVVGPTTICKSDGIDDSFTLSVEGAEGENMTYVVTWEDGEIILISDDPEFNLEGIPGNGVCLFWNLSWDGEIEGAEVGENAHDITGDCFDRSNGVAITEYFTEGGEISTDDPTTICVDDEPDPIDVSLEGEEGENMAWVITDTDLNILDLPVGPPFDLNGAGVGTCLIWHLSWSGDLEGAEIGANAGDLSGDCFDLSNSIEVIREECDDCTAEGGELTVDGPTTICKSDGVDDSFTLSVEGAEGENMTYVVTWEDGEIILISDDPEFNLEGIPGNGVCLFWNLSWDGEIEGAEVGENAFDITGDCFDLSNSVAVTEYFTEGGEISTDDPTTICVDDEPDPIDVTLEGEEGENMAWVITDTDLNILDLPAGPPFDLNGAGVGVCLIWNLSWSGDLVGAEIGANAGDLSGDCFDLSNSIEVVREECDETDDFLVPEEAESNIFYSVGPNPTQGEIRINFESKVEARTTVDLFNLNGQKIDNLLSQVVQGGVTYTIDFDGRDLPPGFYVCRFNSGKEVKLVKFIITK